jgi:hypothetical protein
VVRDIPREEWDRDEPVTLEKSDVRDGLRVAARAAPLMAITHDREAQHISVTVGEIPSGEVTHTVTQPDGIAVEEPAEADEDARLAVYLVGGGQHLVVRLVSAVQ